MENSTNLRQSNKFDFIRYAAAFMVIVTHGYVLNGYGDNDWLYKHTEGVGLSWLGVRIFFIVSGLLITRSIIYSSSYFSYFKKRALRIMPALIVVVLASIFIIGPLVTFKSLSQYFTASETYRYLYNLSIFKIVYTLPGVFKQQASDAINGSLWTLLYEVSCYAGIALMYRLKLLKNIAIIPLVIFFTCLSYYLQWHKPVLFTASLPIFRSLGIGLRVDLILDLSTYFLLGSLLFLNQNKLKPSLPLFILSVILWFVGANVYLWNQYINIVTTSLLVYQLAYLPAINQLNRIGKYGDFSYGLYIWAFPVQQIIVFYFGSSIAVELSITLTTIITLIISALSWHFIEKPAMALK